MGGIFKWCETKTPESADEKNAREFVERNYFEKVQNSENSSLIRRSSPHPTMPWLDSVRNSMQKITI